MSERAYRAAEPSEEQIRERAYEISQREDSGSSEENWERARAELQAEDDKAV